MLEQEIIELIRQKNSRGADELLTHYGPLMRYIISPILPDAHDREECLSEAAMRIWEKIHLYDQDRGSWTAWITAVTRSTALNQRRKKQDPKDAVEITPDIPSTDPTPEEHILRQEQQQELKRALSVLSQKDRLLFFRKYYYLQSTAQIALELGMTERAVEGRLYRVKKRLRKLLGGDSHG